MENILEKTKNLFDIEHLPQLNVRKIGKWIAIVVAFAFFCTALVAGPTLWWMAFNVRFDANGGLTGDCAAFLGLLGALGVAPFVANFFRWHSAKAPEEDTDVLDVARFLSLPYLIVIGIVEAVLVCMSVANGRLMVVAVAILAPPVLGIAYGAPFLAVQTLLYSKCRHSKETAGK